MITVLVVPLARLMLYEEGGFCKAHRQVENADGVFATLTIFLLSMCQGGQLVLNHGGYKRVYEPSDSFEASFVAYGVQSEVTPVTSGYRLALVYSLVGYVDGPGLHDLDAENRRVGGLLKACTSFGENVAFQLEGTSSLKARTV